MSHADIIKITLDEKSIIRRNADIEHERKVAIFDLLEENHFSLNDGPDGPFEVVLALQENRLVLRISDKAGSAIDDISLEVRPFRRIIKDYFIVCESYFNAIKTASPSQIEAIDMGRRSLHDEGSVLLQERLKARVEMDDNTSRRLFTLLCVLHLRG